MTVRDDDYKHVPLKPAGKLTVMRKQGNAAMSHNLNQMRGCKCAFTQYIVGDGCDVRNPAKALEYAREDKRKRTPWFPRGTPPVRRGFYECGVRWTSAMPTLVLWVLEWDGKGFKVPMPMMVKQWRGLAKRPRA